MGWYPDFVLVGVNIDSKIKYITLLFFISIMNAIKVIVYELGEPFLIFNVYNPDNKVVKYFTSKQLLIYDSIFFLISNTRSVFDVLITITQIYIAIFSIVLEQIVSMCTVCILVKEKKFYPSGELKVTTTNSELLFTII